MRLAVLGLNHKTAPVAVRERFSFAESKIETVLRSIMCIAGVCEAMLLSTCNRTELYVVMDDMSGAAASIMDVVRRRAGDPFSSKFFYNLSGIYCARHLFRVASSLDSLIVGEGQILKQLKNAYRIARDAGMTDIVLNTIVNRAIAVGKRVRSETRIAFGSVSVPSTAVDLAGEIIGDMSGSSALIVGAGEMSEIAARYLVGRGVRTIFVSNRSFDRASSLAASLNGTTEARAIRFDDMVDLIGEIDVIISSTGAPHCVLTEANVGGAIEARDGRPLVLIDIAIPRDIEPSLASHRGVSLYDIDDLKGIVDRNRSSRDAEAAEAERMIADEIDDLREHLRYFSIRPTMLSLREKADGIRERILRVAMKKLSGLGDDDRKIVDEALRRLEYKLIREPMIAMRASVGTNEEEDHRLWASRLFNLDRSGDELGSSAKINDWD